MNGVAKMGRTAAVAIVMLVPVIATVSTDGAAVATPVINPTVAEMLTGSGGVIRPPTVGRDPGRVAVGAAHSPGIATNPTDGTAEPHSRRVPLGRTGCAATVPIVVVSVIAGLDANPKVPIAAARRLAIR